MRAERHYAGDQTTRILRISQRSPEEKGAGSAPQTSTPHDERIIFPLEIQARAAQELQAAMKNRDAVRTSTLRILISAFRNKEVERKKTLTDGEALEVIQSEAKRRRESIEEYKKCSRSDLADKEQAELNVLKDYLPPMMSEDELRKLVE